MHEMSICEGIVQMLEEQAAVQHYRRVKAVWLEIGRLAGVELAALRFSFEAVCQGTLAQGARLEIIEVPGEAWCQPCQRTVVIGQRYDPCPHCGAFQLQVSSGEQMRIKELEVE